MGLVLSRDGLTQRGAVLLHGSFDEVVAVFSIGLAGLGHSEYLKNQAQSPG